MRNLIASWIATEHERQERIWGPQHLEAQQWAAVLAEEVGDVAKTANHEPVLNVREFQDQLLHVAAVAMRALEDLGIQTTPSCLSDVDKPTEGAAVWDASPYPQSHWHRRLARHPSDELLKELALRAYFARSLDCPYCQSPGVGRPLEFIDDDLPESVRLKAE